MSTFPTTRPTSRDALVERIVVDGKDITTFRGVRTPDVARKLVEPFGYASSTLTLPQVRPWAEAGNYGTGDLSWLHEGAIVKVQACDPVTGAVQHTRWRGRIGDIPSTGSQLVLPLGGLWTGLAETRNKQIPVTRQVKDIGWWAWAAFARSGEYPGVNFTPQEGPTTGIPIAEAGGMTELSWAQQLCSMATHANGDQWTIMPTVRGGSTFEMRLKDRTTKHYSVFVDGERVVQNLERGDYFNTYFLTGVQNDGMYWDGLVIPGVEEEDDPPTFPGTLSAGDSGEDVLTLNWRLRQVGALDVIATLDFDASTTEAVKEVQENADLPTTGVVNQKTWNALWDVDTMPWTLAGARIEPIVQDKRVRKWSLTPNGSYLGLNPNYDQTIQRRDRNVDLGYGFTYADGKRWAKGQLARVNEHTRTGTITLNGVGVISGAWNPGDAADASRIVSARDIEAGKNLWLANHEGGTLVHIAEVDIQPGAAGQPDTVTLTVDTGYRDALELAEIKARNKESRRDPRREWVNEQRSSKTVRDIQPWHWKAGIVSRKVTCPADTWTVLPVFAGATGTLSRLRIDLEVNTEFCMAIFANRVGRKLLNGRIGNPFPVDADGETVWSDPAKQAFFEDRLLVYSAGSNEQPCGYWPKKHTNRDRATTSNPLTGVWQDDASFGYFTSDIPALWVAIYPKAATSLKRGRILRAQLEPGA